MISNWCENKMSDWCDSNKNGKPLPKYEDLHKDWSNPPFFIMKLTEAPQKSEYQFLQIQSIRSNNENLERDQIREL